MEYYGPFVIWALFCAALSYWFVRKGDMKTVLDHLHGKDIDIEKKSPLPARWFFAVDKNCKFYMSMYTFDSDGGVSFQSINSEGMLLTKDYDTVPVKWFFYV